MQCTVQLCNAIVKISKSLRRPKVVHLSILALSGPLGAENMWIFLITMIKMMTDVVMAIVVPWPIFWHFFAQFNLSCNWCSAIVTLQLVQCNCCTAVVLEQEILYTFVMGFLVYITFLVSLATSTILFVWLLHLFVCCASSMHFVVVALSSIDRSCRRYVTNWNR